MLFIVNVFILVDMCTSVITFELLLQVVKMAGKIYKYHRQTHKPSTVALTAYAAMYHNELHNLISNHAFFMYIRMFEMMEEQQ